ncbi:MAG TPA: two-component system sensor protein, partial [Polyangiaceae bacterium]|nr:two-component system sensor protein [Polyangiaceae bacterium]
MSYDAFDVRARTTLVCGALALVIAISALLRGRVRTPHWLFAGFAGDIGLSYLSQSLFRFFQSPFWDHARVVLAVLLPVFAVNLFEAMVPAEGESRRHARFGRLSLLLSLPALLVTLSPYLEYAVVRIAIFLYSVVVVAGGLWELGQRGKHSRSRSTQRRVRFLVVTGALAGTFTVADFAWVIGYEPAYHPPPVGVVLSVVFLFMLAQALEHERLMDLSEMLTRLLVASAVAFIIAGIFYLLISVVGAFNTMWLNAILVAIVVLVLFNPLRDWVEKQVHRFVFREGGRLEASLAIARRRLAHSLAMDDMGQIVMHALERSRAVTSATLYLATEDGSMYEQLASIGDGPAGIEAATANALLEQLEYGPVVLEQVARDAADGRLLRGEMSPEAVLAAAEVLGPIADCAVVLGIWAEQGERVGLLVVADQRIGDAFSPEDITRLESLASQVAVVIENSRVYAKMKERDRLAVLGQMAAGLAHEIRNPLGAIKGATQLLADPPGDSELDESSREFIGIILEEVDRLNDVVSRVLDLAREGDGAALPIDVNAVVRRTLQVMSAQWETQRESRRDAADRRSSHGPLVIETELDEDLPRSAIVPDQLRQVLMNLLHNAAQATRGEGRLKVTTRTRQRTVLRRDGRSENTWVTISVEDDGPGIAPAALERIFLPFYTTKDEGTGLGLAICQRIVQSAGGHIEVRSRVGEGTTFDVVLPAAMEALGTRASTSTSE